MEHVEPCGAIWSCVEPVEPVEPCGAVWSLLEPVGAM